MLAVPPVNPEDVRAGQVMTAAAMAVFVGARFLPQYAWRIRAAVSGTLPRRDRDVPGAMAGPVTAAPVTALQGNPSSSAVTLGVFSSPRISRSAASTRFGAIG